MIKFAHTEYLYLLSIIPLIILIFFIYIKWQQYSILKFGDSNLLKHILKNKSIFRRNIKYILITLSLSMMIVSLSNPKIGKGTKKVTKKGVEIMIALDVSKSMECKDIDKETSRLEIAKRSIIKLTQGLNQDKIGLVTFAGEAENLIPLSSNYLGMSKIISSINTASLIQGTDIGLAISECMQSFDFGNNVNKTIIIISDGEDRKEGAIDTAKLAAQKGVFINTVCIGTINGGPIPEEQADGTIRFKEKDGEIVRSIPNRNMLSEISNYSDGSSINIEKSFINLKELITNLNKIEKTETETYEWKEFIDRFQLFILIAFILLMLEIIILERKNNKLKF